MKPTNKTQLSLEELTLILGIHNAAKDMVDELQDGFTCRLETASKLQTMQYKIANAFNFQPMQNETGDPNHWADHVLPEDSKAWFSDYHRKQWESDEEITEGGA